MPLQNNFSRDTVPLTVPHLIAFNLSDARGGGGQISWLVNEQVPVRYKDRSGFHYTWRSIGHDLTSVMDPLTLDPDPVFWPNLDPDPGPGLFCYKIFERNNNNFRKTYNFYFKNKKKVFITKPIRTQCHLKKFWLTWVSELWIYI